MIKRTFFLILISSIVLISCGDSSNRFDISTKDTLNINGDEPSTLDWSLATDVRAFLILSNIMEGLTRFSKDDEPLPALAERWDISEDGRTYTFHLRQGLVWSDGIPLRAQDFVYSWIRLLNPETEANYAYFLFDVMNAEEYNAGTINNPDEVGVSAVDDNTLVVNLERPVAFFPSLVSFMSTFPLRRDVVERSEQWTEPENIVTIGPYRLTVWRHNELIEMEEYENYWGEVGSAKRVRMIMNDDATALFSSYQNGELDFLDGGGIPLSEIPELRNSDEFVVSPSFTVFYVAFNVNKQPFDSALVRQAFGSAINRQDLIDTLQGTGTPISSWIPIDMLAHNSDIGLQFNPERARELLSRAGYPGGNGFPEVTFLYPGGVESRDIIAEELQAMWEEHLGVRINLENQEWRDYLVTLDTDAPPIYRAGWAADFPDPDNFMNLFECNSGNNNTGWCNSEYDRLVELAAQELNQRERISLYDRAQRILTEQDAAIVPYINSDQHYLIKPYVRGLEPDPLRLIYFNEVQFVDPNAETNP